MQEDGRRRERSGKGEKGRDGTNGMVSGPILCREERRKRKPAPSTLKGGREGRKRMTKAGNAAERSAL